MTFEIGIGTNIRKSPYFDATVADGVCAFSVYNHMYIPSHFGDPEAEYKRLMEGVAMWDVGAQRQVELRGPDAAPLVQYLCTRDISNMQIGQGRYVAICNHAGYLINDPVLLKLAPDRFWMSIADSDIELWASAIAAERKLDVQVFEPDVSPMAVQGPKAAALIAELFGDWVHELKYFWFKPTRLQGIPLLLARSGWSKQGGFELYLQDASRATELWDRVRAAGCAYAIGPGVPNDAERLESGLLSYGSDARLQVNPANPFELGLDRIIDLDTADDFIGKSALIEIRAKGIARRLSGFIVDGDALEGSQQPLPILHEEHPVGTITEMIWSPRLQQNIAVGLIAIEVLDSEDLTVCINQQLRRMRHAPMLFA